jgi:hypothetical protein
MRNRKMKLTAVVATVSVLLAGTAQAFNMGNMMNPSKWMGGNSNSDRYDDYYGGPGGYGGAPGYYGGGPGGYGGGPGYYGGGPGYGGDPGYGGGPGGYGGGPGYYGGAPGGYGGAPGYNGVTPNYGAPAVGGTPEYSTPSGGSGSDAAEIERLKQRIKKLEERNP